MRIAFVSLNQEQLPDPVVPVGLLYLLANTPDQHEKLFWDLCFETDPDGFLEEKIRRHQPELLALGMRNIQNADYSDSSGQLTYYRRILARVRKATDAPIVLGGSGFSVMPKRLMEYLAPDFGLAGEGEREFPKLVAALAEGRRDLARVAGLHYFEEGRLVVTPRAPDFLSLDELAPPDPSLADPRYDTLATIGSVQTKRGCPLACTYCTYPTIEGNRKRLRRAEDVASEIDRLIARRPSLRHFFIVDSVFNLPKWHAEAVCDALIARGMSLPWTCYVNPLGFDRDLAEKMVRAGCAGIEIGSDSGLDSILLRLKKGFTTQRIRETSRACREAGLKDCHTFILGTQGETLDDVKRSLEFVADVDPYTAILMAWTDDEEAVDPSYAAARRKFRDEVVRLFEEWKVLEPHWIIPPLGHNFNLRFFRFLRRQGLAGPLWQYARADVRASGRA